VGCRAVAALSERRNRGGGDTAATGWWDELKAANSQDACPCPVCGVSAKPDRCELRGYRLFLCPRCGLRFAAEAFTRRVNYDEAYEEGLYPLQTVAAMRENEAKGLDGTKMQTYVPFFRRLEPQLSLRTLLDVGCGGGRFCRAAAQQGWKTLGIDTSEVALRFAREVEALEYRRLDLGEVPGHYSRFDVVTAFEVLEHLGDIRAFLRLVPPVTRRGGYFFCTVPAWEDPLVRVDHRPEAAPPVHLLFFTRPALRTALSTCGFHVLKTGYIPEAPLGTPPWLWTLKRAVKRTIGRTIDRPRQGIWALAHPGP
jgi:SAM-dependent methyltransferase